MRSEVALTASYRAAKQITLPGGSHFIVRPVHQEDEQPLLAFLQGLSLHSRYQRFFSLCPDLARTAQSSAAVGRRDRFGLVAHLPGDSRLAAHAGYWVTSPGRAELALAVADTFGGRGLGRTLLAAIAKVAAAHGVSVFEMDILSVNHAMLRLLGKSGYPVSMRASEGVVTCELQIGAPAPTTLRHGA